MHLLNVSRTTFTRHAPTRLTRLTSATLLAVAALTLATPITLAAEPEPAPRNAEGKLFISNAPGQPLGLWLPDYSTNQPFFAVEEIAFKPWAKGLFDARQAHDLEPHARCKASGAMRQFLTPYGVEILEQPEQGRLYIFDIGGPHSFREVFMDGSAHPAELEPSNYGHSIGRWDGDTLVIDSVGYNTQFWFERMGLPHTESVHITEYFTRVNKNKMQYRFVVEDPLTYDRPFEGKLTLLWREGEELFEYMCQQSNFGTELMVNKDLKAVGNKSLIIP
jgi:hypothetical protein